MLSMKQRCLHKVISYGGPIDKIRLVKLMFVISNDKYIKSRCSTYTFIPYKFGPFSFELYHDIAALEQYGLINLEAETISPLKHRDESIDSTVSFIIENHMEKFRDYTDKSLIESIYHDFPFYTIYSEIEQKVTYKRDEKGIVNIGYQDRSIDDFLLSLLLNFQGNT